MSWIRILSFAELFVMVIYIKAQNFLLDPNSDTVKLCDIKMR